MRIHVRKVENVEKTQKDWGARPISDTGRLMTGKHCKCGDPRICNLIHSQLRRGEWRKRLSWSRDSGEAYWEPPANTLLGPRCSDSAVCLRVLGCAVTRTTGPSSLYFREHVKVKSDLPFASRRRVDETSPKRVTALESMSRNPLGAPGMWLLQNRGER